MEIARVINVAKVREKAKNSELNVKEAEVSGTFYSADTVELYDEVVALTKAMPKEYKYAARAVIAPHAGYHYSGKLAAKAIQYLDKKAKNIFILAPAHRASISCVAICDYDVFDTPLGRIPVNAEINYKFFRNPDCRMLDKAFSGEHSIEVQLPFVKANFPNAKIVPLLVGDIEGEKITKILDDFWDDRENAFIISSDLSHFHSPSKAVEIDAATYNLIESCGFENFSPRRACGTTSIRGLLSFAAKRGFSPVRIGAYNSGNVPGGDPFTEGNSVVGYGAWLLAECSRNKFIKDQFSDCAIDICYDSIEAHFKGEYDFIPEGIPTAFQQLGASFVTLKIGGNLRGCIGSINAHSPLIRDLTQNAYGAAFQDPRFKPLTPEEFESTEISVSLLSTPRRIVFNSEQSLLDSITPNVDGVIIRDGIFQSVYLPCVWEQLPDKSDFLESLKVKAGLPRNHFSRSLEAFKFSVECISSEK